MKTPSYTPLLTTGLRFFLAVNRMLPFLNEWTLPHGCLNGITMWQLAFPQALIGEKEREMERENYREKREGGRSHNPSILETRMQHIIVI